MAARKKRTVEWVGGLAPSGMRVTGEGPAFEAEMILWMGADGAILGSELARPGELLIRAGEHLQNAIKRPMLGIAHAPTRVRVASPELAEVLRATHPEIEIVCAPTPELDAAFARLHEIASAQGDVEAPSYLSLGVEPEAIASFLRAAADFFRAKPWGLFPLEANTVSVTIESLDVQGAFLNILGQLGESFGFLFLRNEQAYAAYIAAGEAMLRGERVDPPPHLALNFEQREDVPLSLAEEISKHGWELAGRDAYPWISVTDEGEIARPANATEMHLAEAITLAVTSLVSERVALAAAFDGGPPLTRTFSVPTHGGPTEVTIRVPYEASPVPDRTPRELLAELRVLAEGRDPIEETTRHALEGALLDHLAVSPEGKALPGVEWCERVMDFAYTQLGTTIAALDGSGLEEIVFDIIPRKVIVRSAAASRIIGELRALFTFLGREAGFANAEACLGVLDADAVGDLEEALGDGDYDPAKSIVMAGRAAGFDMGTQEGVDAFMRTTAGKRLQSSFPFGPPPAAPRVVDKATVRAKKNQRKAARKARKKNR